MWQRHARHGTDGVHAAHASTHRTDQQDGVHPVEELHRHDRETTQSRGGAKTASYPTDQENAGRDPRISEGDADTHDTTVGIMLSCYIQ